jgi:hypothetical protein
MGTTVDSFGLVFLLPIVSANIENALSYLDDQFAGVEWVDGVYSVTKWVEYSSSNKVSG